jgi:hypothetical protein
MEAAKEKELKALPLRVFEIWSEGSRYTGGGSGANYEGTAKGGTFIEACDNWAKQNKIPPRLYRSGEGAAYLWGCRLYDNEKDARATFG